MISENDVIRVLKMSLETCEPYEDSYDQILELIIEQGQKFAELLEIENVQNFLNRINL